MPSRRPLRTTARVPLTGARCFMLSASPPRRHLVPKAPSSQRPSGAHSQAARADRWCAGQSPVLGRASERATLENELHAILKSPQERLRREQRLIEQAKGGDREAAKQLVIALASALSGGASPRSQSPITFWSTCARSCRQIYLMRDRNGQCRSTLVVEVGARKAKRQDW